MRLIFRTGVGHAVGDDPTVGFPTAWGIRYSMNKSSTDGPTMQTQVVNVAATTLTIRIRHSCRVMGLAAYRGSNYSFSPILK